MFVEIFGVDIEVIRRVVVRVILNVGDFVLFGVEDVFRDVKRCGLKVIVIGNVMFWLGFYMRLFFERVGFMRYIDWMFFVDEVGVFKLFLEMFRKFLEVFGVELEEVFYVGDIYVEDFEGVLRVGMWGVWINFEVEGVRRIFERGFEIFLIGELFEVFDMLIGDMGKVYKLIG